MASELRARINAVGGNMPAALGQYHPAATIPGGMVMPMTKIIVTADSVQVHQAAPLYTDPTAAPVPATAPGNWFQLYAAGRA
jgi:hypothetical protein